MNLKLSQINKEYSEKGYKTFNFDYDKVKNNTLKNPTWLHFGAGNIFRIFPARKCQELIEKGLMDSGIIVCETFDEEIIDKAFTPYDNLTLGVTLKSDGSIVKEVIASIFESLKYSQDYSRLEEVFCSESLKMVSLTITEKGYALRDSNNNILPYLQDDFKSLDNLKSVPAIIAKLLIKKYELRQKLAIVSMDNCSHNGTILKNAVIDIASSWAKLGLVSLEFVNYINCEDNISFNWSMIDKITPRPADEIKDILSKDGFEDGEIFITNKNTYVSSFVNAEECEYLAIEDNFPNGLINLNEVGVIIAQRDVIDKIEKMKVCTCLNPLHTALAIFGCLLGYNKISDEMNDDLLKEFVTKMGYVEGMPVVVDPKVMSAEQFIYETLNLRLPNPFIPDTPQRIACDTSKKLSVRFGETIKAYIEKGHNDLSFLHLIPTVLAGYLRYLMGVDDNGDTFEISPDPNLSMLLDEYVNDLNDDKIRAFFKNVDIFGIDLECCNLLDKVIENFKSMIEVNGVRNTITKNLKLV